MNNLDNKPFIFKTLEGTEVHLPDYLINNIIVKDNYIEIIYQQGSFLSNYKTKEIKRSLKTWQEIYNERFNG